VNQCSLAALPEPWLSFSGTVALLYRNGGPIWSGIFNQQYGLNIPLWITVREISNKIPIGTANIDNDSSYNYAMIALFGGQKGRDFFNFQKAGIREEFTAQANDTGRNNRFWTRFMDDKVQINPKYYF